MADRNKDATETSDEHQGVNGAGLHRNDPGGEGDVVTPIHIFFFSSRRRHTRYIGDWSSDVCSSDLLMESISRRELVTLDHTHTFTPNAINSLRFGFSRVISESPKTLSAINALAKDPSLGFLPGRNVGLINVSGLPIFPGGLGATGEFDYHFNTFQLYDDVFLTRGRNSFSFGGYVERIQANQLGRSNPSGNFQFGSLLNCLTHK